jgi:hypothetical protein
MTMQTRSPARKHASARSTGPRTSRGKRQSSANAIKHGLSFPIRRSPDDRAIIEELAVALANDKAELHQKAAAWDLAEAEWDVMRLHHIKVALIEAECPKVKGDTDFADCSGAEVQLRHTADAIVQLLPRLTILARYEGRISARHRRALCRYTITRGE